MGNLATTGELKKRNGNAQYKQECECQQLYRPLLGIIGNYWELLGIIGNYWELLGIQRKRQRCIDFSRVPPGGVNPRFEIGANGD